jgi:pteridine reductase
VLVNNASLFLPDDGPVGPTALLQRRLFEVNAFAPALIMSALAPALQTARGCVVNFLDLLTERPLPGHSAYCASKAALQISTLAFARKLAPHVRVNGIAPGVIDWPEHMPESERAAYLKRVPLGRAGTPTDAAEMVHWLATAAPYVTGQVIRLDGGRSLI